MSEMRNAHERGRREFLKMGGVATAALLTPSAFAVTPNKSLPGLPSNPVTMKAMPTEPAATLARGVARRGTCNSSGSPGSL